MTTSQASTRLTFKTILFATDFSPISEAALPYVLSLGNNPDAKVIVTHAVPIEPVAGITPSPPPIDMDLDWQDAKRGMQGYADRNVFAGVRHEFVLERGNVLEIIADLIAHEGVDLIVLGTHGRKGLRKVFAGSMAEQIFRRATCPVLTIGPVSDDVPFQAWCPKRILFATDFSAGSLHALPYALSLADEKRTALVLLHAAPMVPWEQQAEVAPRYEKRLRELVTQLPEYNCNSDYLVRFDLAVPAILDTAKEKQADLIVMGVHHSALPAIESHVPWATAGEVISAAPCPVLTVRG